MFLCSIISMNYKQHFLPNYVEKIFSNPYVVVYKILYMIIR